MDLFISHLAMSNEEVELQGLPTLAVDAFGSSEMVAPASVVVLLLLGILVNYDFVKHSCSVVLGNSYSSGYRPYRI